MKSKLLRALCVVMILCLAIGLAACGEKRDSAAKTTRTVDVDLTSMSSTLVYAEVFNMLNTPDDYRGKTVRMNGLCMYYHDDDTGADYYTCLVQDALACCQSGIEFELTDGQKYPKEADEITVTGTFDTYMEGEYMYCTLRNAILA